jgi:hypothetical protein
LMCCWRLFYTGWAKSQAQKNQPKLVFLFKS